MKKQILHQVSLLIFALLSLQAKSASSTDLCVKNLSSFLTRPNNTSRPVFFEDQLIEEILGQGIESSFVQFAQKPLEFEFYEAALKILNSGKLNTESVQRAHKSMTHGKANLKFRSSSDARLIGSHSFKGYFALNADEIAVIDANPFLKFVKAEEVKPIANPREDIQVGEIVYPNVEHHERFKAMLRPETLKSAQGHMAKKTRPDPGSINEAILEDLLEWSLRQAEVDLGTAQGKKTPEHTLAMLEWRIKSLGLYFEEIFAKKGRFLESSMGQFGENRSSELAEAIVDTFARKHSISKTLERGYRPQLSDPTPLWTQYMADALEGTSRSELKSTLQQLKRHEASLTRDLAQHFRTYYSTRLLTGTRMIGSSADSMLADFNVFKNIYLKKGIPEESRVSLIPIEYIRSFGDTPTHYKNYLNEHFYTDKKLYRGVSNPFALSDGNIVEYFRTYKGRYASELGRSVFEHRVELSKLSMLKYNADLIEGRLVDTVSQHAAKHEGYDAPNTAKTYLVSLTDLDTIAFRFAVDKGYINGGSANKAGRSHLVFESYQPKHGFVDFSEYKKSDPQWKQWFPRQRETAVAGGVNPASVERIFVIEPHRAGADVPVNGPEKHGKILKIFERDDKDPEKIWLLEKNSQGEWLRTKHY